MAFCISLLLIIIWQVIRTNANATSTGYLITYNQYPSLLDTAPPCFLNGCGSNPLDSMSTNCNASASCYPLWSILNSEYQQQNNWCDRAKGDPACRIPGWPVMNASAVCDASSQSSTWLFDGKTGCCSSEPIQLATWVESMCNGSYQSLFSYFDGMALSDWEQYILPWNWTVQAQNSSGVIVQQPTCPAIPRYLGLFVIENLFFLLFVALLTWLKLRWLKGKDNGDVWVEKLSKLFDPFTRMKKNIAKFFKSSSASVGQVITSALLAIFMASLQLVSNVASAYIIKNQPGYSHVPAPLLTLLFCARPRLGFLACLFSLFKNEWIEKHFAIKQPRNVLRAQRSIAEIALSSAASEIIMQCLAAYSLGRATHVGVRRGFYYVGHLWPYWRGKHARILYLGALFWLIACTFILFVWLAVFITQVMFLTATDKLSDWYKNWKDRRREGVSRIGSFRRRKRTSARGEDQREQRYSDSGNLLVENNNGNLRDDSGASPGRRYYTSGKYPERGQNLRGGDSRAAGNRGYGPVPQEGFNMRADLRPRARAGHTHQLDANTRRDEVAAFENQNLRPDIRAPISASRPTASTVMQTAYERVPSDPIEPEMTQMRADLLTPPYQQSQGHPNNNTPSSNTLVDSGSHAWDSITEVPETPRETLGNMRLGPSGDLYSDTAYHSLDRDLADGGDKSEIPPTYDRKRHFPKNLDELQPWLLFLGFFIGLVAYIAQWLFWAGFVNTSGERYVFIPFSIYCLD